MSSASVGRQISSPLHDSVNWRIENTIAEIISALPDPGRLSADQRRGIIARYTAVLEGNFIYWMTGAYLAVRLEESRLIVLENLRDEIRDCHPAMLRRFAVAAQAVPTLPDTLAVSHDLMSVRLFVGRLAGARLLLMMVFFEALIQRFMPFLAELAERQGSEEMEYTNVHSFCDVAHSQELFRALASEMTLAGAELADDLFEGVDLLRTLIGSVVGPVSAPAVVGICAD
jgi:hypothetical protein